MAHEECRKLVTGAKTAVLFLHGIVGTPNHFRTQIPLVEAIPKDWSAYVLLLPGHGGDVDDFAAGSMKKWKAHVWDAFRELSQSHERVAVVGHSMGTLFAIQLAVTHPEQVPFLFLLAVPMVPFVRPSFVITCLRFAFGRIREDKPLEKALEDACGTLPTAKLWKYGKWIPRFLELFREISLTYKQLHFLGVPTVAWQSTKDKLVANFAGRVLKKFGNIEVRELIRSTHLYYDPEEQQQVIKNFLDCCEKYIKKQD